MHVCSGTTADYTLALPSPTGNAGKLLGVRMAAGLTKLVTLDAGSGVLIDGQQTRVMWAGESALLLCDGTGWSKVAGVSVPMRCRMYRGGSFAVPGFTHSVVPLDATDFARPAAMADSVSGRVAVVRPGVYEIQAVVIFNALSGSSANTQAEIYRNGSVVDLDSRYAPGGSYPNPRCRKLASLAAGDFVSLAAFQTTGNTESLYVSDGTNALDAVEVPTW